MKSRNISIIEFFDILQQEYFEAELRKKIYPTKKDKAYYQRVMDWKKTKILDISNRNGGLANIFDDEETKKQYYQRVYNNAKILLTPEEIEHFYFLPEAPVKTEEGLGEIIKQLADKVLVLILGKGKKILSKENVIRVF